MHPTSKQYEKTLGKVNWLNSSLPKKGVRSCVYELYWLVAMRKCPYWLQWLTRYDKNRQFSKCNENNRKQKHIWTHRGLNFSFLWEEVCATMKGRDNWLFFPRRYSLLVRLIFTQNGRIQDRIYRNNSDLLDAYHYIRGFRDFQTKTVWGGWMGVRERLVQDPSLIVQPRGNELCSFQRP